MEETNFAVIYVLLNLVVVDLKTVLKQHVEWHIVSIPLDPSSLAESISVGVKWKSVSFFFVASWQSLASSHQRITTQ